MRLGLNFGLNSWQNGPAENLALAQEAERLGYHSVWTAEAWGTDAVTPLAWLAAKTGRIHLGTAIMQMPARTPAMAAMTAATLDLLSGGRFLMGLGVSGPQVVEGWHGVLYGKPLVRTREYVEIVRSILCRAKPLEHHGEHYDVPARGGTGLGKPLKLLLHPLRTQVAIYLGAIGPKNVALAAEIADGWLPIFFSPFRMRMFREWLEEGFGKRTNRAAIPPGGRAGPAEPARQASQSRISPGKDTSHDAAGDFDIAPSVTVVAGDDLAACRNAVKPQLALYIGGMGARDRNFYFNLACRYGYEEAAGRIQQLFLSGKKASAAAAVPDELVDEVALCGPRERIAERLAAWRGAGVTTLICSASNLDTLRLMAELNH
jgi:alkanesulfonate monooxygenase SsuD/methylene tetrahydromethanopterin reductase-like flavin-dependent oxidoreductase (luciferase family)